MSRALLMGALFALTVAAHPAASATAPAVTRVTLKNGLQVVVVPSTRLPLVDLRLVARAGAAYDPAGKEGLARLTADLLTQGAGKRSAQEVAEAIEFVGGSLFATAGSEQFSVGLEVLTKDLDTGLELFRDVIVSPSFSPEEFARKQEETLGQIASDRSEPSVIAEQAFARTLWGDGPLAHPAIGTQASVTALTQGDVAGFHRRFVTPARSTLVVVGDVDPKALVARLETSFAGWKGAGEPLTDPYRAPAQVKGRHIRIVDKPEATQAQIRMGCIGVPRSHPDYYAMRVANTILGSGFTSRLVNSIRVEQGLTYSINSQFPMYRNAGLFRISTFTRNEQLRKCVDAVLAEVKKLVDEGPTDAELDKARNYLKGQYPIGLQAPDDLAEEWANVQFFGLPQDAIARYNDGVSAVTMADVKRVLRERVCVDDLQMVVVTNAAMASTALEGLGEISVVKID